MIHLLPAFLASFEGPQQIPVAMFAFLSVGAIALFGIFLPVTVWMENRRKEREAYYKSEMFRRLAESSGDSAKTILQLVWEEDRQKRIRVLEALKVAGLVNVGVGVALVIFLRSLLGGGAGSPYLCGLIPGLIGAGMLAYVYFFAAPVDGGH